MTRPLSTGPALVVAAILAACASVPLLARLDAVPGLHGDEAWAGRRALEIQTRGAFTPHGMHWYTGAIQQWMLAAQFSMLGPGVAQMRMPGAVLNALAAGGAGFFVARLLGLEAALFLSAYLLLLPFYPLEGRVAWEVCALNHILAIGFVGGAWGCTRPTRARGVSVVVFFGCAAVGTISHIIFLSVPTGLALGLLIWTVSTGEPRLGRLLFLSMANAACSLGVLLLKAGASDVSWQAHRHWWAAAFPAAVLLACWAACRGQHRGHALVAVLASRLHASRRSRRAILGLGLAGVGSFLAVHGLGFLQTLSGTTILARFFGLDLGAPVTVLLVLWAAGVVFLVGREVYRALGSGDLDDVRLLVAVLLCGCVSVLTLGRVSNWLRYYILPYGLFGLAVAAFLPRAWRALHPAWRLLAAVAPLLLAALYARELAAPRPRPPIEFRQGYSHDTSAHFLPLTEVADALRHQRVCRFEGDGFIVLPLEFLLETRRWACDPARRAHLAYDRQTPPFVRAVVGEHPRRP